MAGPQAKRGLERERQTAAVEEEEGAEPAAKKPKVSRTRTFAEAVGCLYSTINRGEALEKASE